MFSVLELILHWHDDSLVSQEARFYILRDARNIFLDSFDHRLCKHRPVMPNAVVFYVVKYYACKLEVWVDPHI